MQLLTNDGGVEPRHQTISSALILGVLWLIEAAPVMVITLGGAWTLGKLFRFPNGGLPSEKPTRGELITLAVIFAPSFIWWILYLIWGANVIR